MKLSYARYNQMMLEEKRRQSVLDSCVTRCANIKEIRKSIIDGHDALGDRVKELNAYLDDISERGRQKESKIRSKLVSAIMNFAAKPNISGLFDAANDVVDASTSLANLLGQEDAQNREIQALKRRIENASRILRNRNQDLKRFSETARRDNCSCGF